MERNWHYDSAALMNDHGHLTGNVHVVGARAAYILDGKVVNGWKPDGGSYEEKTKGKGCTVGTSSMVNPKLCEDVEYVGEEALD